MMPEKWEEIKGLTKDKFEVLDEGKDLIAEADGGGQIEFLVFNGPLGKMKLEFTIKPRVLGTKTLYSKLAGSAAKIQYQYSPDEMVSFLKAYKWDDQDDNWVKMEASAFGG